MPPLPVLSGRETVRNFERFGWSVARQRASHIIMTKPGEITIDASDFSNSINMCEANRGRVKY